MILRRISVLCLLMLPLSGAALADGFRLLSREGRQAEYEGTLVVSGRFERRQDAATLDWRGDRVCFYPDAAALAQLPHDAGGKSNVSFCFSNHHAATEKLQLLTMPGTGNCGVAGTATVAISHYVAESGGDVFDQAWLERVEKQGPNTALRCP